MRLSRAAGAAILVWCIALSEVNAQAHGGPLVSVKTRPERTGYRETSSYADVMEFSRHVAEASPLVHLTSFGYTSEGRSLPLVVVGRVADASPAAVLASSRTRLFVQANIHAGEVCGKEAMQMLIRDLANGAHREWLDSLVLLIAPIYNADGNERVNLTNRRGQHGPVGGMGQRTNALGLDLNRDHMKVDAPETRSLLGLIKSYDPHVLVDLHTTNGTEHAYHLTYAPPLNPITHPAITALLRGRLLPAVSEGVRRQHGWEFYYYGNLPWREGSAERGWYTFDHRPRFSNNYVGLRNRIGILGEAYSYATFEDRVLAAYRLVEEGANFAHLHASDIEAVITQADTPPATGERLPLRAAMERSADSVDILLGITVAERNPYSGQIMRRRLDVRTPERMPEYGTFRPTATERLPLSYLIPSDLTTVLSLLEDHGVEWRALDDEMTLAVERFVIDSATVADREFQGHREVELHGHYEESEQTVPAGTGVVRLDQPLARLAFYLLEPQSDDGVANWDLLGESLRDGAVYPILRTFRR